MPVLMALREKCQTEQPLKGMRIAGCLHVTKETAVLVRTLRAAGAEVQLVGLQPALDPGRRRRRARRRGHVDLRLARPEHEEFYWCIDRTLDFKPTLTLDDGADLIFTVHTQAPRAGQDIIGGTEETTTGVHRLRAMARRRQAPVPGHRRQRRRDQVGLRQRLRHRPVVARRHPARVVACCSPARTSSSPATATAAAACAMRAAGHGRQRHRHRDQADRRRSRRRSRAIRVMTMDEAAKIGDIFITATGHEGHHRRRATSTSMKDGAIVCNTGHYDCEINLGELERDRQGQARGPRRTTRSTRSRTAAASTSSAQGRLVNLAAAEGHPSEVMDMSLRQPVPRRCCKLAKEGKTLKQDGLRAAAGAGPGDRARSSSTTMGMKIERCRGAEALRRRLLGRQRWPRSQTNPNSSRLAARWAGFFLCGERRCEPVIRELDIAGRELALAGLRLRLASRDRSPAPRCRLRPPDAEFPSVTLVVAYSSGQREYAVTLVVR